MPNVKTTERSSLGGLDSIAQTQIPVAAAADCPGQRRDGRQELSPKDQDLKRLSESLPERESAAALDVHIAQTHGRETTTQA